MPQDVLLTVGLVEKPQEVITIKRDGSRCGVGELRQPAWL
jgi:hypothetical protein